MTPFDPFWTVGDDTLRALLGLVIETSGTVVECGSGRSTVQIAKLLDGGRRHVALEQGADFWGQTLEHLCAAEQTCELALAPLVNSFYPLPPFRDGEIGLLFIDGPDHGGDRAKALSTFERYLAPDAVIVVDDATRDADMLARWRKDVPGWSQHYLDTVRGCAVLRRTPTEEKADATD